jgi:formylglycine-generating enzyme required for sulfatase activity
LPDGTRIPFLLIPMQDRVKDPRSFYIMKNKVSNKLFAAFMKSKEAPGLLERESKNKPWVLREEWQKGGRADDKDLGVVGKDDLPALRVTVVEAYCFASWLGGDLPSRQEWEKAAGQFEKNPRPGPFVPPWNPEDKNQIAVNRQADGPMPVGRATKDISPFGCRDMSGNGLEWTRTFKLRGGRVPLDNPQKDDLVVLVARSYEHQKPLTFEDLERRPETEKYQNASEEIGFRVVLERP